jgi:hypothetical protein
MHASLRVFRKALPIVLAIVAIKIVLLFVAIPELKMIQILQLSEISVVFTGGFFVMGFMLAGTLGDLKESEKIPGELATHFEILKEIILDDDASVRTVRMAILSEHLKQVIFWLNDKEKHSKDVFFIIDEIHQKLRPISSDLDRRFFEQLTGIRRIINRTYVISRTVFAQPAYFLQRIIVIIITLLVLLCEFKTTGAAISITFSITLIFFYLLFLVRELDDPFLSLQSKSYVDLKPLENVQNRIQDLEKSEF